MAAQQNVRIATRQIAKPFGMSSALSVGLGEVSEPETPIFTGS
jgi:hypothetical protein